MGVKPYALVGVKPHGHGAAQAGCGGSGGGGSSGGGKGERKTRAKSKASLIASEAAEPLQPASSLVSLATEKLVEAAEIIAQIDAGPSSLEEQLGREVTWKLVTARDLVSQDDIEAALGVSVAQVDADWAAWAMARYNAHPDVHAETAAYLGRMGWYTPCLE